MTSEKDKIIFKNSIVMLLLFTFTNASKGLKNLTLSVYPEVIRRGQSAQLHCSYEVYDVPLYSVKWYRGIFEFYRYTPFEHPAGKTFFFNTGIKVDLSVSNATHVTLRNVDFNLNGNISCEVTTESPSFYTATATSVLQVVELPHSPPTLWTEFTKYDPGDILRANCSTQPSKPSATITFLLNQYAVGSEPIVYHQTQDNLLWSSKDLRIQILPSHYLNGQLILRCTAEVGTYYADFTEAPLETTRKEPIPERDLKAFERRLTEVLSAVQPNCLRWRIVLCIVTLIAGISAFFWLRDPATSVVPFLDSLLNHYVFTTSALTLITLFCYGIHKLVISPQIIISRTRTVLSEFNLSCDEAGKIILRSRPNAP